MSLEIRVLGPLEVVADGEPLRVDTRKALAIVALLAVERRPYARDELAAMLWPESDDESARGALRRTLSVLRAALGGRWLRIDRSAVALPVDGDVTIDLATLDEADTDGSAADLARVAAIARGPFLAGFSLRDSPDFDDWRATRAVAVERRLMDVLERLAVAAESTGDHASAAAAALRLVELDPLDEPARRRLMTVLAASGDRAGAIRVYRSTVAILDRELGVAPLAETTTLYEAIRDARPGSVGPPPASGAAGMQARAALSGVGDGIVEPPAGAGTGPRTGRLPMVGRDAPLAAVLAAHRRASPDGRVAVVRGEAGIGKSRLAEAVADRVLQAGGAALVARAFPAEGSIAYGLVAELLREGFSRPDAATRLASVPHGILGELSRLVALPGGLGDVPHPAGDSPGARGRLLEAVATVLAALVAGPTPGLLVVEDLQWADDASREAIRYLARRLAGRPLLLVATWRPEDLDGSAAAFADALQDLDGSEVVDLRRLAPDDVRVLVDATAGPDGGGWDAAALAAESEGLPLYVVEALAAGPGSVGEPPRPVRVLLHERLASVGETAGQVVAAAAVIGRAFDLETLRVASGRSEEETVDALEELVRRAILREHASGGDLAWDFGHARLRDAAYGEIGLARRRLLHRRVADALRAAPGRDDVARLALIATHEQAAGRDAAAAEAFRDAGIRAREVFAYREAAEHLGAAIALGAPDAASLEIELGEVRTAMGDYAGAIAALEAAAAVAPDDALPGIELRLGRVHARRGDAGRAASHLDEALAIASDPVERGAALVERGAVALRAGDLGLAASLAGEASAHARATSDDRLRASALRLEGLVEAEQGDTAAARAALLGSLSLADGTAKTDPGPAIAARNALALVAADAGDRDTAIELLVRASSDARHAGEPHLEAAVENNLADQLHAAGRPDEAMLHLKRAVALFADVGGRPGELEPEIWKLVSW